MIRRYFLQARASGGAALIRLNDAPVVADLTAAGVVACDPVDPWIKPGRNLLQVDLDLPRLPPEREFAPGQVRLELTLFVADPDAECPRPGQVLWHYRWPEPGLAEQQQSYPVQRQLPLDLPHAAPDTLLWQEAEPAGPLQAADQQQILGLVDSLRAALAGGEPEQAYQLLSYRYADEARAEGKPEAHIRDAVLDGYRQMLSWGPLEFAPVDAQQLALRPHADGLVVHVMRPGYQLALLALHRPSGSGFGIPAFASRIRGVWTLVR